MSGAGTLLLAGSGSSYTGPTTITSGTLQAGSNSSVGAGPITIASTGVLDANGFNPTTGIPSMEMASSTTFRPEALRRLPLGRADRMVASRAQSRIPRVFWRLVKAGSGTQVLSGTNTYSGGTYLNGGVLNFVPSALPISSGLPTTGLPSISFGGGTLRWAAGNTLDVSAAIAPIPSGVSAGIDTNGNNVSFASTLSGTGGLTKAGAGTLMMTIANSYSGATNITGGSISITDPLAFAEQYGECVGQQWLAPQ